MGEPYCAGLLAYCMWENAADLMYIVAANSGTEDGQLPRPGTPAWEAFVREVAGINIRVASAEEVKEMLDEIFKEED